MTKTIAVTGGSGGAGHFILRELLDHGYACINIDVRAPEEELCPFRQVDMNRYEDVFDSLEGTEALVHFAANPHPDDDHSGAADRFSNNTNSLFNAFNAAQARGISRIVWASSETVYGFPFATNRPASIPVTENAPLQPQNGYALSKVVSEELARRMHTLYGMDFIGLRLSNVLYDDEAAEPSFQKIPSYWEDLAHRKFNMWGYVDARDVADVVRKALEIEFTGADVFSIAAPDTIMKQDSRTLIDAVFPGVQVHAGHKGRNAMLNCEKARVVLDFDPQYTWSRVLGIDA